MLLPGRTECGSLCSERDHTATCRADRGRKRRISESILEQGTYNDKLYALGVMESSVGLYYNKDILEEAGIEVPMQIIRGRHQNLWIFWLSWKLMDEKNGYPIDMDIPGR